MNRLRISPLILFVLCGTALAQNPDAGNGYLSPSAEASAGASAGASSHATSVSGAVSGSIAGAISNGGYGGNGGAASIHGISTSMALRTPHQAPAMFMSAPAPTAPCQATAGGFGTSPLGGGGAAWSRTLKNCEMLEAVRIAHAIGQPDLALQIFCTTEYAAETRFCRQFTE